MANIFTASALAMNEATAIPGIGNGAPTAATAGASPFPMLLEWFFPGTSMFLSMFLKSLSIDSSWIFFPILIACTFFLVWHFFFYVIWDKVEAYWMSVVNINVDDEIHNMLMGWIAGQTFSQGAYKLAVSTSGSTRRYYWQYDDNDYDEDDESEQKKKALQYTPSFGSHWFWYKGHWLQFQRSSSREQQNSKTPVMTAEKEEVSIACFGRNPAILKQLLNEARDKWMVKDEHKTQIYRASTKSAGDSSWQRCMSRATRHFSTVILSAKMKEELINDVTDYLNPVTQRWYANRGIPYRRGYLLYGPPGTGKSSLSLALAGHFKMRIYIVTLNSETATEETLGELFAWLPRKCIVLLEDIDAAGLTHTRDDKDSDAQPVETTVDMNQENNGNQVKSTKPSRLSLSGLLNILDGVASQEGRILIMTTNHVDKLDKALIRPGRVDMIVKFDLADNYMSTEIFKNIFAHLEGDDGPGSDEIDINALMMSIEEQKAAKQKKEKEREIRKAKINELAKAFAAKIPEHEFSPAELQGHLMKHKHNPEQAVATAEEFVVQMRKQHKDKEIKAAEAKRKAEQEEAERLKEEEAKKAAENGEPAKTEENGETTKTEESEEAPKKHEEEEKKEEKQDNTEEIMKKVTGEFQKVLGDQIRDKVEAVIKKTMDQSQQQTNSTDSIAAADATKKSLKIDTKGQHDAKTGADEEPGRSDSGYATPSSTEGSEVILQAP